MTTPHPDLELLSALVDDIDEGGTGDHVRGCAQCTAAVQALRRTARLVGEQPATTGAGEDRTDEAVTAALAAAEDERTAPIVPLTRRRRLPAWVLPAAAAILVVAAGVPLAAGLSSSRSSKHSTAANLSRPADQSAGRAQPSGDAASTEALSADLGPINDPDQLRSALATTTGAPDAPAAAATAGKVPTAAVPAPSGATAGANSSPTAGSGFATCPISSPPPGATTVYTALLIWQGTPAQVEVQTRADGSRIAIVTSRANCAELLTLRM
jgi:hypothetical protein